VAAAAQKADEMATNFQIVVDNGGGTTSTVTIPIPTSGTNPGSTGDVQSLAQDIARNGVWDTSRANFYPPVAIRKVSPV
jgi:hypothetical protein